MTSILIVDDHALMRIGLRSILELQNDIAVAGEAPNGLQAVALAKKLKPDVVIMDLMMPELGGADATREILAALPETKIIILSSFGDSMDMARAIEYGAVGALQKESATKGIIKAIKAIIAGRRYIDPEISASLSVNESVPEFTERQNDVLKLIVEGLQNKAIANRLGISRAAVDKHIAAIFEKLGVNSRAEAVATTLRKHLL